MKTKTFEDSEKIEYVFAHGDKTIDVVYHKKCFVFYDGQEIDFDKVSDNDLNNWIEYIITIGL